MEPFQRDRSSGGYHSCWSVNGRRVVDGDYFVVKWPDGKEEVLQVEVKKINNNDREHTSYDVVCLKVEHNGLDVKIKVCEDILAEVIRDD